MPRAEFIKRTEIGHSFRVEKIKGLFDLTDVKEVSHTFRADIPIENMKWSVGLIAGASGTGKTSIARELFPDFLFFTGFDWSHSSMIEDFRADIPASDIATACSCVGLASAPDWLKPYHVLSNGQKMRADLARLLCENADRPIIYDEFTSVVDRQIAQITSAAISKFVRSRGVQFIAVSCHKDIIEWLDPDWIFDTDSMTFYRRSLQGRPKIELQIREGKEWEWQLFKSYHYLSGDHNSAARKFVAEIEGTPVAWCSVLHMPNRQKNMKRVHRLVVRPDFQGIGIGKALLAFVGDFFTAQGYRITIMSSLGTFCKALCHDYRWSITRHGYAAKYSGMGDMKKHCSHNRLTASFEYVG